MPSHRRPPPLKAVGTLQSNRLPLGTPQFARDDSPPLTPRTTSRASGKMSRGSNTVSHGSSDSDTPLTAIPYFPDIATSNMAPADVVETDSSVSRAAAKLERQNKRIEQTNALTLQPQPLPIEKQKPAAKTNALTLQPQPLPTDKQKPAMKTRAKAWVPFDFGGGDTQTTDDDYKAGPTVTETRINTFRPASQASSLSRPVSRISQKTTTSVDSDRQSSRFLEADEFQLFTGRKVKRPYAEDRPESRQATVEATFSKREVSDIFGNQLPGPSFMDGNPGTIDGQVQFIQHPNGDVSAHQWYASRYQWANLGQYSNIRKKIEGGLEKDRIKGETASQALKQNTLAYFRAIVKQREAHSTGQPFGPKEIAAALPDTRPPSAAPTGPKKAANPVKMPTPPAARHEHFEAAEAEAPSQKVTSTADQGLSQYRQQHQPEPQQLQYTSRFNPALNFTPAPRDEYNNQHSEDPFTFNPYRNIYGPNAQYQQTARAPIQQNHFQQPYTGLSSYGQYPQQTWAAQAYAARDMSASTPFYEYDGLADQVQRMRIRHTADQQHSPASSSHSSLHVGPPHHQTTHHATAIPGPRRSAAVPSQPSTPRETRTAARENVMKMTEHAKERTKSQANFRTVLHDPFLSQPETSKPHAQLTSEPEKKPLAFATAQQPSAQFPSAFGHIPGLGMPLSSVFPTTLAPSVNMPLAQGSIPPENNLRDSSPDREWQRKPTETYDVTAARYSAGQSNVKPWEPAKIDEWWWSGNKFARQEELFQCIIASDKVVSRRQTVTSPSASAPIGTPHSKANPSSPEKPAYDERMTRLLVPVLENLASYVQGPEGKRRDYFSQWVKAPEWAIDRSPEGNNSFFDSQWGQPPARVGRDPRYRPVQPQEMRFGSFEGNGEVGARTIGLDRRFGFGGRYV